MPGDAALLGRRSKHASSIHTPQIGIDVDTHAKAFSCKAFRQSVIRNNCVKLHG